MITDFRIFENSITNNFKNYVVCYLKMDAISFVLDLYDPSKKTTKSLVLLMNLTFRLPLFNI